jgi:hypothetical protein
MGGTRCPRLGATTPGRRANGRPSEYAPSHPPIPQAAAANNFDSTLAHAAFMGYLGLGSYPTADMAAGPPPDNTASPGLSYIPRFQRHNLNNMIADMSSFSLPSPLEAQRLTQAAFRGFHCANLALNSVYDGFIADPL